MGEVLMLLKEALRVIKTVCRILPVLYLSQNTQCLESQREWSKSIIEEHCWVNSKAHDEKIGKKILKKVLLTLVKSFLHVDVCGIEG